MVQTHVDADLLVGSSRELVHFVIAEDRDEVAPSRISGNRQAGCLCLLWNSSAPTDVQRCVHLSQSEFSAIRVKAESCGDVGDRLDTMLGMEGRVLCPPGKEITKGGLQVAQGLLNRDRGYFRKPGEFRITLELGQQ